VQIKPIQKGASARRVTSTCIGAALRMNLRAEDELGNVSPSKMLKLMSANYLEYQRSKMATNDFDGGFRT
jgi:hypothetical protein